MIGTDRAARVGARRRRALALATAALALALASAGCGKKPNAVSAPQGEETDTFPRTYPTE